MAAKILVESDLRNIRELLGVSGVEFSFLMGSNLIGYKLSPTKGKSKPIKDPRTAILMRLMQKFPDGRYFPMPEMPSYTEVYQAVKDNWIEEQNRFDLTHKTISAGTFGPMMGVNFSAGYGWSRGGNYDTVISRLFWVLNNMIQQEGRAGLIKFLEVVDEEAKSRDIEGGVAGVFKRRGWTDYKDDEKDDEEAVKDTKAKKA